MTDPTPIAADPHVSGGVEVMPDQRAHLIYNHWDRHPDAPAYWFRLPSWVQEYAARCVAETELRLAATPVPANAEGVREAVNRIVGCGRVAHWLTREGKGFQVVWRGKEQRVFYADRDDAYEALWELRTDAVLAALTTRPTDTAAREAAVEAATKERCAKVADAVESQDEAAEPAYLDACQTISERIRALTPTHIADAGEGDTAARDEGMVR